MPIKHIKKYNIKTEGVYTYTNTLRLGWHDF